MHKMILSQLLLILAPVLLVSSAYAALPKGECNITLNTKDDPACGAAITSTINYSAVRSDPGNAAVPIDIWNYCRYLDNNSTKPVFVPFRTAGEWGAFVTHAPFNAVSCSRPSAALIVPAGPNCPSPQPAKQTVSESDYYRWSPANPAIYKVTTSFKCSSDATGSWTQTANAVFTGKDADKSDPSWGLSEVIYNGGVDAKGNANPPCRITCSDSSCPQTCSQ